MALKLYRTKDEFLEKRKDAFGYAERSVHTRMGFMLKEIFISKMGHRVEEYGVSVVAPRWARCPPVWASHEAGQAVVQTYDDKKTVGKIAKEEMTKIMEDLNEEHE